MVQKRSKGRGLRPVFRGECACGWKGPEHDSVAAAFEDEKKHRREKHRG